MNLITPELLEQLPPLYAQEGEPDALVYLKFFTPDSNWTWYAMEFDQGGGDLFFGWVVGFEKELGYFSLKELYTSRGPHGLSIERDITFQPTRFSIVKSWHRDEREGVL